MLVCESSQSQYHLLPSPPVTLYLIDLLISQQTDLDASSDEITLFAREMIEDTTFRFLAKRDKESGLVTSLLVTVGGDERYLLFRQEHDKKTSTGKQCRISRRTTCRNACSPPL